MEGADLLDCEVYQKDSSASGLQHSSFKRDAERVPMKGELTVRSLSPLCRIDVHITLSDVLRSVPRGERGGRSQGVAPGRVAEGELNVGRFCDDASLRGQIVSILALIKPGSDGSTHRTLVIDERVEANHAVGSGRDKLRSWMWCQKTSPYYDGEVTYCPGPLRS